MRLDPELFPSPIANSQAEPAPETHDAAAATASRGGGGVGSGSVGGVPRSVERGTFRVGAAENGPNGGEVRRTVRLHWLRVVGSRGVEGHALRTLQRFFGPVTSDQGGLRFYGRTRRFASGAMLLTEHKADSASTCVDVPGSALDALGHAAAMDLCAQLARAGMRATRCDIAIDVEGEGVQLVEAVEASCAAGELTGLQVWGPAHRYGSKGKATRLEVDLGRRGKNGCGRYVRVYDKGLESGDAPPGFWHRFELEATGSVAAEIFRDLARAISEGSEVRCMAAAALGSVGFHEANGEEHLARRPVSAWWRAFIDGCRVRCYRATRGIPSTEGFARWFREAVAPRLVALAEALQMEPMPIVAVLGEPSPGAVARARRSALIWEVLTLSSPRSTEPPSLP